MRKYLFKQIFLDILCWGIIFKIITFAFTLLSHCCVWKISQKCRIKFLHGTLRGRLNLSSIRVSSLFITLCFRLERNSTRQLHYFFFRRITCIIVITNLYNSKDFNNYFRYFSEFLKIWISWKNSLVDTNYHMICVWTLFS